MDDKSPPQITPQLVDNSADDMENSPPALSLVDPDTAYQNQSDEIIAEISAGELAQREAEEFARAKKEEIRILFEEMTDREIMEVILYNQIATRDTLAKMDSLAEQFAGFGKGLKPSDLIRLAMGKG